MIKEFQEVKEGLEKLPEVKQRKLIELWLKELKMVSYSEEDEIRDLGLAAAWDFLKEEEDLYQEYLKK